MWGPTLRRARAEIDSEREEEEARGEIPEEFVDPILHTVMEDPVTLPGSGVVVDRETIQRHLLSDATDPFSRSPLDVSMLVDAADLRRRIRAWRLEAPSSPGNKGTQH